MDTLNQRSEAPLEIGVSEILGQAQQTDRRFDWINYSLVSTCAPIPLCIGIFTVLDGAVETKKGPVRREVGGVFLAVKPPQLALLVSPLGKANELGRIDVPQPFAQNLRYPKHGQSEQPGDRYAGPQGPCLDLPQSPQQREADAADRHGDGEQDAEAGKPVGQPEGKAEQPFLRRHPVEQMRERTGEAERARRPAGIRKDKTRITSAVAPIPLLERSFTALLIVRSNCRRGCVS
jgi:hypothetical protein